MTSSLNLWSYITFLSISYNQHSHIHAFFINQPNLLHYGNTYIAKRWEKRFNDGTGKQLFAIIELSGSDQLSRHQAVACGVAIAATLGGMYATGRDVKSKEGESSPYSRC